MELNKKLLVLLPYLFLLIATYIIQALFFAPVKNIEAKLFTINKGEAVKEIAFNLKRGNLIKDPYVFIAYIAITGKYSKVQAGDYLLSSQMSAYNIINILINGETAKETITIIEGWDLRDLNDYLEKIEISTNDDFFNLTGIPTEIKKNQNVEDLSKKFSFLKDKPANLSLEGYLFPDTYYIDKGDDAKTLIEKALSNFDSKLSQELRDEIKKQKKTIFEIITMASMIEKEVKTLNDKKIVSGILWKRIENGMRLQVDATVLYATGKGNSKVYTKDTQFDSPYNTYRYDGLPVGPISNPGIDSIVAAIYPTKTNNLYYLSTPDGKTIFSKTLEEHNYNKNKYLK
ncbi:MAG: endolytic transglycosylase MltG [Candidatus Paceibacterota bacterium]|jgi:UPF0755 protein